MFQIVICNMNDEILYIYIYILIIKIILTATPGTWCPHRLGRQLEGTNTKFLGWQARGRLVALWRDTGRQGSRQAGNLGH